MDAIPPSYEHAITKDALAIIANYIPSADLCSASLVSRRWHAIFNPHIWGDPASHFGTENDVVYVALTRFKRTLKNVRLEVRSLTHTLHLPPALSERYDGPHATWLKDLLDHLPRLQSLLISGLPFFDHNATITLKIPSDPAKAKHYALYNLRLLLARGEPNTTSIGLATALSRFLALVYLDLSYTSPAKDQLVLSSLSGLTDLQILKLRGIGLKDTDAESLINAIGKRVRVLDIRNNMFTDSSVKLLLQGCFVPIDLNQNQASVGRYGDRYYRDHTSNLLRSPVLDEKVLEFLTRPLMSRSIFEDLPNSGITHLYISDNRLTVDGVADLLASRRLHVLDTGSVDTAVLKQEKPLLSTGSKNDLNTVSGAEKLIPILGLYAGDGLTHLRINHAVVTKDVSSESDSTIAELPPASELVSNENTDDERKPPHYIDTYSDNEVSTTQHAQKIQELLSRRPNVDILPLRDESNARPLHLHPSHIRHVKTLILTDVPSHVSANSPILSSLIHFITACSDETLLAILQARENYSFPPGRDRMKAEQLHAKSLFALERLVLEITPITRNVAPRVGSWKPQDYDQSSWKSTTGDVDSERLWSAAVDDFSFFDNDEGDVPELDEGIPNTLDKKVRLISDDDSVHEGVSELEGSLSPQVDSGKLSSPMSPQSSGQIHSSSSKPTTSDINEEAEVDLVSALTKFRREKQNEFEELKKTSHQQKHRTSTALGSSTSTTSPPLSSLNIIEVDLPLHVEGHWPGEVKVIRNHTPRGRSGVVDIYGNYFEKGYLYP